MRRPPVGPSEFVQAAASLRGRRSIRPGAINGPRLLVWSARGPFERRLGTRLRSQATRGATIARGPSGSGLGISGAVPSDPRPRTLAAIASSPHTATSRPPVSASDHPQTGCNSPIGHTRSATTTSSPRQPPPPVLRCRAIRSVSFPRRPLDPGEQHGPPSTSLEGLEAVGGRAEDDEVVRCAPAPQTEPARCPDVVELELAEAVVRDPEPREDATAVTSPHLGPHTRRDRIWRAGNAAPMPGRVPTKHRPWDPQRPGFRPPRSLPAARLAPR